jgi:hypothetical protein
MQTKQMKRDQAAKLADARAKLSPAKQIKELDKRLGKGKGAVKERARLATQMQTSSEGEAK